MTFKEFLIALAAVAAAVALEEAAHRYQWREYLKGRELR